MAENDEVRTITRGDLKPDMQIQISDESSDVDFSVLALTDITIIGEQGSAILFTGHPDDKDLSDDGKILTLVRDWGSTDTAAIGRIYVRVVVMWPDGDPQTFPAGAPLALDVRRAAGD